MEGTDSLSPPSLRPPSRSLPLSPLGPRPHLHLPLPTFRKRPHPFPGMDFPVHLLVRHPPESILAPSNGGAASFLPSYKDIGHVQPPLQRRRILSELGPLAMGDKVHRKGRFVPGTFHLPFRSPCSPSMAPSVSSPPRSFHYPF